MRMPVQLLSSPALPHVRHIWGLRWASVHAAKLSHGQGCSLAIYIYSRSLTQYTAGAVAALVSLLGLLGHERKPSFSPFFFASLISPWTCFPSAPICVPKFLMTAHAKHWCLIPGRTWHRVNSSNETMPTTSYLVFMPG